MTVSVLPVSHGNNKDIATAEFVRRQGFAFIWMRWLHPAKENPV